jgi:hypothetical protein
MYTLYTYIYTYSHTFIFTYSCLYIHMSHTFIYIYHIIHMYINIYIYTHDIVHKRTSPARNGFWTQVFHLVISRPARCLWLKSVVTSKCKAMIRYDKTWWNVCMYIYICRYTIMYVDIHDQVHLVGHDCLIPTVAFFPRDVLIISSWKCLGIPVYPVLVKLPTSSTALFC